MTKKQKRTKREIYRVRFERSERRWIMARRGPQKYRVLFSLPNRHAIVIIAAGYCRSRWQGGRRCQLIVHNKGNGRISFERTYPDVTPRRKG